MPQHFLNFRRSPVMKASFPAGSLGNIKIPKILRDFLILLKILSYSLFGKRASDFLSVFGGHIIPDPDATVVTRHFLNMIHRSFLPDDPSAVFKLYCHAGVFNIYRSSLSRHVPALHYNLSGWTVFSHHSHCEQSEEHTSELQSQPNLVCRLL